MASQKQLIIVSSKNPVKIRATQEGFQAMLPDGQYDVRGISVPSGVPDQPMTDDETLQGALNRVQNARGAEPDADFWIGLEGGVDTHRGALQCFAWIAIEGRDGRTGKARTAAFQLPEETAKLVRGGMEQGHADEIVFDRVNSKQQNGSVGLLTNDVLDRAGYYAQAVILALIPFKNANLTFT